MSLLRLTVADQRHAKQVGDGGIVGIPLLDGLQERYHFSVLTQPQTAVGKEKGRLRIARRQLSRLGKLIGGFLDAARLVIGQPEIEDDARIPWVERQRLLILHFGLVVSPEMRQQHPQVRLHRRLFRTHGQEVAIAPHGAFEVARLLQLHGMPQQVLRRGLLREERTGQEQSNRE